MWAIKTLKLLYPKIPRQILNIINSYLLISYFQVRVNKTEILVDIKTLIRRHIMWKMVPNQTYNTFGPYYYDIYFNINNTRDKEYIRAWWASFMTFEKIGKLGRKIRELDID